MKHTGDLVIRSLAEAQKYAAITQVSGGLYISAEGASLPTLTEVGGWLYISAKGASLPKFGDVLAFSTWALVRSHAGKYYAGCRGPWSAEEALAHWSGRHDERAQLFTAAIRKRESA